MIAPRTSRWVTAVSLAVVAATFATASAAVYTGFVSTEQGSNLWTGPGGLWSHELVLQWTIDSNAEPNRPAQWHYHYQFSVMDRYDNSINFFVLETSPGFDGNANRDFRSSNWKPGTYTAGLIGTGGSPGMPEAVPGIKYTLDGNRYIMMIMDFYSPRGPKWGDFYALGPPDIYGDNYAYNRGFTHPDIDPEPNANPPQSGCIFDSILVPDTNESNEPPIGTTHILQVFKFRDVSGTGAAKHDPNFRLSNWHIDVDGSDLSHFDANSETDGGTLFGPLDGSVSWRASEIQKSGWSFTGAWLENDANGAAIGGKITDPNAIFVNLADMDVNVYIGNIPEPATMALLIGGCACLLARYRRRRGE